MDVLLTCLDLSSSGEELQALESPFRTLCCLLIYLFMQVTAAPAVATQALPPPALRLTGGAVSPLSSTWS